MKDLAINTGEDLRQAYCNAPLLVERRVEEFLSASAGNAIRRAMPQAFIDLYTGREAKPYEVKNGVAIIEVRGMLEHKSDWYSPWWTGYNAIRQRVDMAMEDYQVKGVLFVHHSGGGHVAGNFDLNDHLFQFRGKKPMWTMVDEYSYSGAYSLASATDKIFVTRTGGVGSIGAVVVMANYAQMFKENGIAIEVRRSGTRKMKPNHLEAFEQADLDRVDAEIDHAGDIFIQAVARNRGMKEDDIRALQGATAMAEEAVTLGLVDGISTLDKVLQDFQQELSGSLSTGGHSMTVAAKPDAGVQSGITQEMYDAAVVKARAEGVTEGKTLGAKEENDRVISILSCEEAQGKQKTALALAANPAMTADSAKTVLATVPAEAVTATDPLTAAMVAVGTPGITGEQGGGDDLPQASEIDNMVALYDGVHGAPEKRH